MITSLPHRFKINSASLELATFKARQYVKDNGNSGPPDYNDIGQVTVYFVGLSAEVGYRTRDDDTWDFEFEIRKS